MSGEGRRRWLGTAVALVAVAAPALAAQRADSYGAIAYGPKSSAWGSASGEGTAEAAQQKAVSFCARHADDCRVVATFSNSCGAVAVVEATGATFLATNEKRGTAENQARLACTQKNPSGCRVAASICALP
ncbi:MAG TPA: DUF4189 domain-containing protein [Stellaceae bacterium]|nr:DUF4189 domain-containing protein [Stellaceae bacterium]